MSQTHAQIAMLIKGNMNLSNLRNILYDHQQLFFISPGTQHYIFLYCKSEWPSTDSYHKRPSIVQVSNKCFIKLR